MSAIEAGGINTVDPCHGDFTAPAKRVLAVIYSGGLNAQRNFLHWSDQFML